MINSDGYWMRASDYSIYLETGGSTSSFTMQRDVEQAGRAGAERSTGWAENDTSKPIIAKVLAVPALRARYLSYVRDIARRWLDWNRVGPLVRQWQALIESDIRVDTRKLYSTEAFHADLGADYEDGSPAPENTLRGFIERRREFLLK